MQTHSVRKRAHAVGLAMMMTIALTACGIQTEQKAMVSMYDLGKTLIAADASFPEMSSANSSADNASELFAYLSDMDYEKVEGFYLGYAAKGSADEVAVICVKEEKDLEEAKESLKTHVDGRISLYKTYDPSQVERAQAAEIFTEGRYAVMIISDHAKEVHTAFSDFIK